MAVLTLNRKILSDRRSQTTKRSYEEQMLNLIAHKTHVVHIGCNYLYTPDLNDSSVDLWYPVEDFKMRYPEKWQEIQAELALQRLKDSGV